MSPLIGVVFLMLVTATFGFLDVTGRPRALVKYKVQEEKPVPVSGPHRTITDLCPPPARSTGRRSGRQQR